MTTAVLAPPKAACGTVNFSLLTTLVKGALADSPLTLMEITDKVSEFYQHKHLSSVVHVVLYRLAAKGLAHKKNDSWTK